MSDQPKEPEKTTYQRDKTAKGPQPTSVSYTHLTLPTILLV